MIFEWDEAKDKINAQKHGVSFDEAKKAFADPGKGCCAERRASLPCQPARGQVPGGSVLGVSPLRVSSDSVRTCSI